MSSPVVKNSPKGVVPSPAEGPTLPAPHKIVFRDRNDAEGVAQIYFAECKTKDLKSGKEQSVADLAKTLSKDLDMANARYNSSHKQGTIQKEPFDRDAYVTKWLKDHVGDAKLNHDGETKSASDFVRAARNMVNNKSTIESPLMLDATALHFKDNRKVSPASLKAFTEQNINTPADGQNTLKHDIKIDDERHGTINAGVFHLKGRSGAGLPGGSISAGTDDRKWGLESERVLKVKPIKTKQ